MNAATISAKTRADSHRAVGFETPRP
ncbi:MAG: hypothetical protein K0Q64_1658, partial [Nitrobacter vulgaris]|nr:hypothetical protein [Nitrobacter vulgaris]